ncbi:glucose-6-phosphate dehydrogenase assembly protein OpcA [Actinotignum timonense]|nr:glucose-6-phosphate dehydrogenase assembly protein OpcA [Actinotignum timonense]MDK6906819.1 glucose-6-phosphate dehydrogenase assembly protein OpcA [Actinotignum timonense]MDK8781940.1 glucose-6-phosphate dehydrogenase assembly protein OpcA [Actinotignum timonense]
MINHIADTTSAQVGQQLDQLRGTSGVGALGRVLTLIIVAHTEGGVRDALEAAAGASRAHPSRIIAVLPVAGENARLDAEIRTGSEAGASEIVILRAHAGAAENVDTLVTPLLLPDTPVVTWWIQNMPENPAATAAGRIAQRRITTTRTADHPALALQHLSANYVPGDTDLGWAGTTLWRNYIASMVDEFPGRTITGAKVWGRPHRSSLFLLAAWLRLRLDVPVEIEPQEGAPITGVEIFLNDGAALSLHRTPGNDHGMMLRPGRAPQEVSLPVRSLEAMLIEDLRDLNPDTAYGEVLTKGLPLLDYSPADVDV